MGALEREQDNTRCVLRSRHLVGRSSLAHLVLSEPSVSAEHARLAWSGTAWELNDLGSKNGTYVDGRRLAPGERVVLAAGMRVTFGASGPAYRVVDVAPPAPMARAVDSGAWVIGDHDMLALPDAERPEVTLYRDATGAWALERDGGSEEVADGAEVRAGGQRFVLHVPDVISPTWESWSGTPSLPNVTLRFSVSRDGEFVSLAVVAGSTVIDLGARAHHALLLALSRARLQDEKEGLPESSAGWVYLDDVAKDLDLDEMHVNVAIYRARKQLAAQGVQRAAEIVERRKATQQLRIGARRSEIREL